MKEVLDGVDEALDSGSTQEAGVLFTVRRVSSAVERKNNQHLHILYDLLLAPE